VFFHANHFVVPERLALGPLDVTPLVTIGWAGVDVFFVLSGFLITLHMAERLSSASPRASYGPYLRDRILRVVPAYWAQLALLLAFAWIATGSLPAWAPYLPAHLLFLQNFTLAGHAAINGVYWSLPVEFAFYLVCPFLVLAAWPRSGDARSLARRAVLVAAAGIAISAAWRVIALSRPESENISVLFWRVSAHLPGAAEQFAIGSAAAMLFAARGLPDATRDPRWRRLGDALLLAGLAGFVGALYLMDRLFLSYWGATPLFFLWNAGLSIAVAVMIAGVATRGPLARALFENLPAVWLGTISYSLYLWHPILLPRLAAASEAQGGGLAAFLLVAIPALVAASAASYYLVERPFLRRKQGAAVRAG
jgi:peptidoglycan/LPS O-acetylase OafA/YrhL